MKKLIFTILVVSLLAGCQQSNISGVSDPTVGGIDIFAESKMEGWGKGLYTAPEYDGDDMPIDGLVVAKNIDFNVKKSIAPRQGILTLGTQGTSTSAIKSLHTSKSIIGREVLIRTSTTTMEWYNEDDSTWEILDNGYTNGKEFTFADGNISTDTENYTYFSNGSDSLRRFRVAFGSVASNSSTAITLNSVTGYDSADDIGFMTSASYVTIGGTDYAYTGVLGWSLTGMTGVPALTTDDGVINTVETTGFTSAPSSTSAIIIKDQRMYAAYKNSVYCSKIDNFRDFSYSAPRVASEGEIIIFPEGGSSINGLGIMPDYVAVFKKDYIGKLEFKDFSENLADLAVINTIARNPDIGATSQKAIIEYKGSVMYSNIIMGVSSLVSADTVDTVRHITQRIKPTVEDYDFSKGAIVYFDNLILNATNNDSNFNNNIIVYDTEYDRITEYANLNASSFAVYNSKLYYGDSQTQNVYQLFATNYDDNDLPYTTEWKTKWINYGYPALLKEIGYVYVEGFINTNTSIDFTILLDEGGKLTSKTVTIKGTGDFVAQDSGSGFGINPFGLVNFSDVEGDESNLKHFAGFINTSDLFPYKFRNVQFSGKTSGVSQNYRISKIISYVNVLDKAYGLNKSTLTIP